MPVKVVIYIVVDPELEFPGKDFLLPPHAS
jgi:hypothetical protein